jgi:hypothetical protein
MHERPNEPTPIRPLSDEPAPRRLTRRRLLLVPVAAVAALAAWPLRGWIADSVDDAVAFVTSRQTIVIAGERNVVLEDLALTIEEGGDDLALEIRNCRDVVVDGFQFFGGGILVRDSENVSLRNGLVSRNVAGRPGWSDNEAGVRFLRSTNVELVDSVVAYADSLIRAEACEGVLIEGCFTYNPRGPFPRGQHFQTWQFDGRRTQDLTIRDHYSLTDFSAAGSLGVMQEDAMSIGMADNVLVEHVLSEMRGAESGSSSGSGLMFEGRTTARVNGFTSIGQANAGFGVSGGSVVSFDNVLSIVPQSSKANIAGFAWQNAIVTLGENVRLYGSKPDGGPYGDWWTGNASVSGVGGTSRGHSNSQEAAAALASVVRPPLPDVGFELPEASATAGDA